MKSSSMAAGLLVSLAGFGFAGSALAQATWNWGTGPGTCDPSTCVAGGVTATVAGFGSEALGAMVEGATVVDLDPNNGVGLGVRSQFENTSSPNHSIDNKGGDQSSGNGADYAEFLSISFSQAVRLTQVAVSWTWTDSDAMIFRWDGPAATPAALTSLTAAQLPTTVNNTTNGWTLVASNQFASSSGAAGSINLSPTGLFSSHWLVSTALGQASHTANNDGFKIGTFTGTVAAVPEPGSLALAGLALLGVFAVRRKR